LFGGILVQAGQVADKVELVDVELVDVELVDVELVDVELVDVELVDVELVDVELAPSDDDSELSCVLPSVAGKFWR
jgi:hypothetical protein